MWWERWLVEEVGRRGDGREENRMGPIQFLLKTDGRESGVAARRCGWEGSERRQHPNNDMNGAHGWKPETRNGEARQRKDGSC